MMGINIMMNRTRVQVVEMMATFVKEFVVYNLLHFNKGVNPICRGDRDMYYWTVFVIKSAHQSTFCFLNFFRNYILFSTLKAFVKHFFKSIKSMMFALEISEGA